MYAIVEMQGLQYRVEAGKKLFVNRMAAEKGAEVTFEKVLLVDNNGEVKVGTPVVEGLCSIANLSDTQFRKKFFEIHATTPLNYINTLRVNYAADLLSNSPFSIDEIALASGFSDYKYFSTVFKKYKHTTPSGFRKIN